MAEETMSSIFTSNLNLPIPLTWRHKERMSLNLISGRD